MQLYTPEALATLDQQIESAQKRVCAANRLMGQALGCESNPWEDRSSYEKAEEEVGLAKAQLHHLHTLRAEAKTAKRSNTTAVEVGSKVTIKYDDGTILTVVIDGYYVGRNTTGHGDAVQVSTDSPIGAALIGRTFGDPVEYSTPKGVVCHARITALV